MSRKRTVHHTRQMAVYRRELPFYLMLLPGTLFTLVFSYFPLFGLVMAFQNFVPLRGFQKSEWVGLQNFRNMLALPNFWNVIGNTLFISICKIILGLLVPLLVALQVNEVIHRRWKQAVKIIYFLPYFLSWAVVSGMLRSLFQYDGMVNDLLVRLGMEPILFLGSNVWFLVIVILSDVWKDMGYYLLLFLAAIADVDPCLFEAAAMDGANRFKRIWHVTLPSIQPIVIMLFVLSLGSVLNAGMEQIMLLYNPMVYQRGDIIDTFVYRLGLVNHQWSLSSAVGMMKSVLSFFLVMISNQIVTKRFAYQLF